MDADLSLTTDRRDVSARAYEEVRRDGGCVCSVEGINLRLQVQTKAVPFGQIMLLAMCETK